MNVCQSTELPRGVVLLVLRAPHGSVVAVAAAAVAA